MGEASPPLAVREFCVGRGVSVPAVFLSRMAHLAELLFAANVRINLTRIGAGDDFWVRHVADSLGLGLALPELCEGRGRLLDLGCGAGFPALVLAAAYPGLAVTALDSHGRKAEFVRSAAVALGLDNCAVVTGRGREQASDPAFRESFDLVVARAVGHAGELCRESHRLLRPGGCLVLYKTPAAAAVELIEAQGRSPGKHYAWRVTPTWCLPGTSLARAWLIGTKPGGLVAGGGG